MQYTQHMNLVALVAFALKGLGLHGWARFDSFCDGSCVGRQREGEGRREVRDIEREKRQRRI